MITVKEWKARVLNNAMKALVVYSDNHPNIAACVRVDFERPHKSDRYVAVHITLFSGDEILEEFSHTAPMDLDGLIDD